MSEWSGALRSNYFTVHDLVAFETELEWYSGVSMLVNADGKAGFQSDDDWGIGVYIESADVEMEGEDAYEFMKTVIMRHMIDGDVAVIIEAGHEDNMYLGAWAVAFNNKGEQVDLHINRIYDMAKDLGSNITEACY